MKRGKGMTHSLRTEATFAILAPLGLLVGALPSEFNDARYTRRTVWMSSLCRCCCSANASNTTPNLAAHGEPRPKWLRMSWIVQAIDRADGDAFAKPVIVRLYDSITRRFFALAETRNCGTTAAAAAMKAAPLSVVDAASTKRSKNCCEKAPRLSSRTPGVLRAYDSGLFVRSVAGRTRFKPGAEGRGGESASASKNVRWRSAMIGIAGRFSAAETQQRIFREEMAGAFAFDKEGGARR